MAKKGMLLVGHGSKLPYNKDLVETTAKLIAEKTDEYIVRAGFMSLNTPTVQAQLEAFRMGREDGEVDAGSGWRRAQWKRKAALGSMLHRGILPESVGLARAAGGLRR